MADLLKFQTPPAFPKLGVSGVRSSAPIIDTKQQVDNKIRGAYAAIAHHSPGLQMGGRLADAQDRNRTDPPVGVRFRDHASHVAPAYVMSDRLRNEIHPEYPAGPKADLATQHHENFHEIMDQVQQRYGRPARQDLARNLVQALETDPRHGAAMKWFNHGHVSYIYNPGHSSYHEEVLAKLHNVLNDPGERAKMQEIHMGSSRPHLQAELKAAGLIDDSEVLAPGMLPRKLDLGLKSAHKHLRELAASADTSWLRPSGLQKAEAPRIVALIQAHNSEGHLLLGKRKDNGKWTLPGGHADPGESPEDCARRELKEETGLDPESLTPIRVVPSKNGRPELHLFSALVFGTPHSGNDPDAEVSSSDWEWVDIEGGMPDKFWDHLHGPEDDSGGDDNVVRQAYDGEGLEKAESVLPKGARAPKVDWNRASPDDYASAHPGTVRQTYIPIKDLNPVLTETRNPGQTYDWSEFDPHGTYPPIQVGSRSGKPDILEGNHRVHFWRQQGFTHAPALYMEDDKSPPEMTTPIQAPQQPAKEGYQWPHPLAIKKAEGMPGTYGEGITCLYGDDETCPDIDCSHNAGKTYPENPADASGGHITEASVLLQHPDPVERSTALKLDSITPHDVATAAMDPDPMVWRLALLHPDSAHAKHVIAGMSVLPSGESTEERHNHLLQDPDISDHLLETLYNSALGIDDGPLRIQRRAVVASHPRFVATPWDLASGGELKKHWADDKLHEQSAKKAPARASMETTMPHLKHLEAAYLQHQASADPISVRQIGHGDSGDFQSPKAIYKISVPGHQEPRHFMVKPYAEAEHPLSGWAESSNQALYHAAGIGHLHQQTFTAPHGKPQAIGKGSTLIPAQVIHLEEGVGPHHVNKEEVVQKHPDLEHDLRKIGIMDFLTGNADRHAGNLMIRPNGVPMAIDHGAGFGYRYPLSPMSKFVFHPADRLDSTGLRILADTNPSAYSEAYRWWEQQAPQIRQAFEKRLDLITGDPETRKNLETGFNRRAAWLDDAAKTSAGGVVPSTMSVRNPGYVERPSIRMNPEDPRWAAHDARWGDKIEKKIDETHLVQGATKRPLGPFEGTGARLVGSQPAAVAPRAAAFENHVMSAPGLVEPAIKHGGGIFSNLGVEPKTIYHTPAGHYMVKAFHSKLTPHTGWNEAGSQALYHAAGIGHLHQGSHVSIGESGAPASVIHMEPGHKTWGESLDRIGNIISPEAEQTIRNPEHMESLRRIGLMDNLLGNTDRHEDNIMIGPNGQPKAIDNGLAFNEHHWYADDRENTLGTDGVDSRAESIGGTPTSETWAWWNRVKEPVRRAFDQHAATLADPDYRAKLSEGFHRRLDNLEALRRGSAQTPGRPAVGGSDRTQFPQNTPLDEVEPVDNMRNHR